MIFQEMINDCLVFTKCSQSDKLSLPLINNLFMSFGRFFIMKIVAKLLQTLLFLLLSFLMRNCIFKCKTKMASSCIDQWQV